jgi:ABC-2 type transport system ATP-binding protein
MGERFHTDAAVQIQRLRKSFNDNKVLKNVSFRVGQGNVHGLIGLSGAGKTTLLNCLVGYYDSDGGTVLIGGEEPGQKTAQLVGFTTQESCFYADITVKDNIKYFGNLYSLPQDQMLRRAHTLLQLTGLQDTKHVRAGNLSGGMQRRFDLVLSLLHDPDILILDEPASGLDPKRRHTIWNLVKRVNRTGVTTIISSHLLNDLEEICDEISLLHKGTIVNTDTPQRLRELFSHHFRLDLHTTPGQHNAIIDAMQDNGIEVSNPQRSNETLRVEIDHPEHVVRHLGAILDDLDETLLDINIEKPGLESLLEKVS